jgi:phosphoenolpyruvate carboxylase
LAHELSVGLEKSEHSLDDFSGLIKALSDQAIKDRASQLSSYVGLDYSPDPCARLKQVVSELSDQFGEFSDFKAYWERTLDVAVFTGHPTFLMSRAQRGWLTDAATGKIAALDGIEHLPDADMSLKHEHEDVLLAMEEASGAIGALHTTILDVARERFPSSWRELTPAPIGLATWVGYDMDGRTDIGWQAVIRHRLEEKLLRLNHYRDRLNAIRANYSLSELDSIGIELDALITVTQDSVDRFGQELSTPEAISATANHLTQAPDNLTSATKFEQSLHELCDQLDDEQAAALKVLIADINVFKFGAGEVHFRLNASQIRNAARRVLDLDTDDDLFGHKALESVQTLICKTKPIDVNFASLAIERSAASRLMIAMAQILKHIDSDQPIRLLIAELENPVTVLVALYLSKLFGIEDRIDICPLFETPKALDRSRRILDVLFQQPCYVEYVRKRGRIAVQAGFSDAGRFMGQISASLAIERMHGHMADLMGKHGLGGLQAVIFDTHGESMGRGNHQVSFTDRSLYALSPWAREQFASRGIPLIHESSFQGGDGYTLFGNSTLARATLAGILDARLSAAEVNRSPDPFYLDTSTSLDFYRTVKSRQETLYADVSYQTIVSSLGLSFLPVTGSRKTKRQFDFSSTQDNSLRKIRAIPHNAVLQQIGLLANLTGGIGQALSTEQEYFETLSAKSDRFHRLMTLVARARSLSEIKIFIAYMKLFDGSFWATRPLSGKENDLDGACSTLARELSEDQRYYAALRLAATLRSDSTALSDMLEAMGLREANAVIPKGLDILHAIRIAIIQHMFILAARMPNLSPFAGTTKADVLKLVFSLQTDQAVKILEESFPLDELELSAFTLEEPASYPGNARSQNADTRKTYVEPLKDCMRLIHQITNGVSHYYRALG